MDRQRTRRVLGLLALLAVLLAFTPAPAAGTPARLAPGSSQPWQWPLGGEVSITEPFDGPAQDWLPGHRGVDLAAAAGTGVLAPAAGVVSFRGTVVDRPVLVIDHGHGFKSSLEPVSSDLAVGQAVAAGQLVAEVADGAHCARRCLHWGVRLDGKYIDPALLIRDLRPSILLPLE